MKLKTLYKTGLMSLVALGLSISVQAVAADEYPSKTIEVVTHAGAGGGTDVTTRMMMLRARRVLKQDMVIVNKKGGCLLYTSPSPRDS